MDSDNLVHALDYLVALPGQRKILPSPCTGHLTSPTDPASGVTGLSGAGSCKLLCLPKAPVQSPANSKQVQRDLDSESQEGGIA
jgi:hypothetical protein